MSDTKFSITGLIVWFICAIFFTYEFLLRTVLGTFQHPIMLDLQLTPTSFALLSSTAYLAVYGVMQVPVGIITEKFGLKKSLTFAVIACALPTLLFALTYQFKSAILARMLMGLGSSFGFVCLLMAVYEWIPKKYYGLFIGLSQMIGTLGPMLAAGPLHALSHSKGLEWRIVFTGLGIAGGLLAFIVFSLVKNNRENVQGFRVVSHPPPLLRSLHLLFSQKQAWFIATYSALVYFSLEYLSENEGIAFMMLNGHSNKFASYMITVGWLGYAIGCPLLGFVSDFTKRRKSVLTLSAFICLIAFLGIMYIPHKPLIAITAFFLLGIGASGQSVGFAIMAEQCNKSYLAAGLGLNNAFISLLSSINAPIVGMLLDIHKHTTDPVNSDYLYAFSFIAILISISILLSIFKIKETYCRSTKGYTLVKVTDEDAASR